MDVRSSKIVVKFFGAICVSKSAGSSFSLKLGGTVLHCSNTIRTKSDIHISLCPMFTSICPHIWRRMRGRPLKAVARWLHLELMERSKKGSGEKSHYSIWGFGHGHYRMTHHIWEDRMVRGQKHRLSHYWWLGEILRKYITVKSFKFAKSWWVSAHH